MTLDEVLKQALLRQPGLNVLPLEVPAGWRAWLLPVPQFPLAPQALADYADVLSALRGWLLQHRGLQHQVVLQTWKLSSKTGTATLDRHADDWPMEIGFGIWPDREPPQGWNENSIQDAAAAVYRGEEPPLPIHRILLLTLPQEPLLEAARQMQGLGVQMEFFSAETPASIAAQGRDVLLPLVKEHRFRKAALYLPLLDRRTLQHPDAAEKLGAWMCGIDVYLRESAEDKGFLLLVRQ